MTSSSPIELHKHSITFWKSACIALHNFIHRYIHSYIHTYIQTDKQTYIRTCMHTCIHAWMHECMNAYMHTCIHAHIHTYIQTNERTNKQTNKQSNNLQNGRERFSATHSAIQSALSRQFSLWSLQSQLRQSYWCNWDWRDHWENCRASADCITALCVALKRSLPFCMLAELWLPTVWRTVYWKTGRMGRRVTPSEVVHLTGQSYWWETECDWAKWGGHHCPGSNQ